jgi:MarR family transcriptional regulator, organic hydroperoxide resistance regulator
MKLADGVAGGARERPAGTLRDPQAQAGARSELELLRSALARMSAAERRLRGRDHKRAGELTVAQLRSLAALGREREMTAGQLARSADLNPATVTAMLDHLEAANIVERRRSTEDRRVCNVSLTPEGWELLQQQLAGWQSVWEQKLAGVSDRDLAITARVIAQITDLYDSFSEKLDNAEPRSTA